MEIRKCLACGCPMKMEKKFPNGKSRNGAYRKRRFNCTICDYSEMVVADGYRDDEYEPWKANQEIEKHFKQQSDNQQ